MEEVTNTKALPPYPQMILEAIDSQNKEEGLKESTISSYLESTYGDLPADHSSLLSVHLAKMKDNGELLLLGTNYRRPDPTVTADPATAPVQKRGRGRPRKNPSAQPVPKKAKTETDAVTLQPGSESVPTGSKTGRPRGRPKKVARGRPKKVQPEQDQVSENGGET